MRLRIFLQKKIFVLFAAVAACLFFNLVALDSYCDEGGNFALGICSWTRFIHG